MENRLCLNKRPKYELPNEVIIGFYNKRNNKPSIIPDFKPDICINSWGVIGIKEKKTTSRQYWIKTDNKKLIYFIESYNFDDIYKKKITNSGELPLWKFKKILLEEFYGVKNGE